MRALLERERLGSTSVGWRVCHSPLQDRRSRAGRRSRWLRFADPVEFGAPDDDPVRFFFVVLSPPDQPAAHLQVLSQIARILKREDLRSELLTVADR